MLVFCEPQNRPLDRWWESSLNEWVNGFVDASLEAFEWMIGVPGKDGTGDTRASKDASSTQSLSYLQQF